MTVEEVHKELYIFGLEMDKKDRDAVVLADQQCIWGLDRLAGFSLARRLRNDPPRSMRLPGKKLVANKKRIWYFVKLRWLALAPSHEQRWQTELPPARGFG